MSRDRARGGGRQPPAKGRGGTPGAGGSRRPGGIDLGRLDEGRFELVHPRCVEERREDYEEGLAIWRAGEPDEARDVLRYALEGCGDNLWIHVALGRIALEAARDPNLARGHFGYAVELVQRALPRDFAGRLPPERPANGPFYEAIDGLVECCQRQGKAAEAAELRAWAARLRGRAGLPGA
jgi:hypothetical protein